MRIGRSAIIISYCAIRSLTNAVTMKRNITNDPKKIYDLVVIGGGSGGLACAKEAASFGKNVAVIDYVTATPRGTQWGLGGTCVNVGCIPKKLMHHIAQMRDVLESAKDAGWTDADGNAFISGRPIISWTTMATRIQNYVRSLNWGHRVALRENNVTYINAQARFKDAQTVTTTDAKGIQSEVQSRYFVISVGGRPKYPDIPGAKQYGITSDDLFWLQDSPGKTLVIGGSYVALECAGFLQSFGCDTTVMVRSVALRGFDRQMVQLVTEHMKHDMRIKFLMGAVPTSICQHKSSKGSGMTISSDGGGKLLVRWTSNGATKEKPHEHHEWFDTVLFAIGRNPSTDSLNLGSVSVRVDPETGKIASCPGEDGNLEQTSNSHIFAIGDVIQGGVELTPVAVKAGKLLARRLFRPASEMHRMDYDQVPTTIFTPLEYACVGLAEEAAIQSFGSDNVEVYHCYYKPLEFVAMGLERSCYMKMICHIADKGHDSHLDEQVVGLHIVGPNAGEVLQGFAAGIKAGLSRQQLCLANCGIHPTSAEEVVKMHITKRSGVDPHLTGC